MKIKKNNDILDLLEIYDGVLIDWELHSKKYMDLYRLVYPTEVNRKYKMFRKSVIKDKPFWCCSSNIIRELLLGEKKNNIYLIL